MSDEPRVLEIRECPICHRNAVSDRCSNCGFELDPEKASEPAKPPAKPDQKPEAAESGNAGQ